MGYLRGRWIFGLILMISMFFLSNQGIVQADEEVDYQTIGQFIKDQIRTTWENHLTRADALKRWQEKCSERGVDLKYIGVTKVEITITFDKTNAKADVIGKVIVTGFGYSTEDVRKVRYVEEVRVEYRFRKNGDFWEEIGVLGVPLPGEIKEGWPSINRYMDVT